MGKLSYKKRQMLPANAFAIPEKRAYPIYNKAHARNALARVSAFGTQEEKERVRNAVHTRYPSIDRIHITHPLRVTPKRPAIPR